jgi:hypothetical protein
VTSWFSGILPGDPHGGDNTIGNSPFGATSPASMHMQCEEKPPGFMLAPDSGGNYRRFTCHMLHHLGAKQNRFAKDSRRPSGKANTPPGVCGSRISGCITRLAGRIRAPCWGRDKVRGNDGYVGWDLISNDTTTMGGIMSPGIRFRDKIKNISEHILVGAGWWASKENINFLQLCMAANP